jgi:hypothetical protein
VPDHISQDAHGGAGIPVMLCELTVRQPAHK